MHLYAILKKFKIYIKTLKIILHVLIIRSSSGRTYCSLLKLYIKTISDVLHHLNLVAASHLSVFVSYAVQSEPVSLCTAYDTHTGTCYAATSPTDNPAT